MAERSSSQGWFEIFRLGLVQAALGAIIVLTTSTLNRVMVVELGLLASVPGLLVGWHYAVQITRPRWGFGADRGGNRSLWILGGMAVLAVGGVAAASSAALVPSAPALGIGATFIAFTLIGGGVGAAGTNLLALLAIRTPPERKAAAAAVVWIMMIVGFVLTTAIAGSFLDPFTMTRLIGVTAVVGLIAFCLSALALWGIGTGRPTGETPAAKRPFNEALANTLRDTQAWRFTVFIFVSMLAYSAQDLILEPFAGLVHGYTPGQSTRLAATQNGGVLVGMVTTAVIGTLVGKSRGRFMRSWTAFGCAASGAALAVLAAGALVGEGFPLRSSVFVLGLANGMFAVAAIGSMMTLASAPGDGGEGTRMGVWGASQAIAFGLGGLIGAGAIDLLRATLSDVNISFAVVFALEGLTFLAAGLLALRVGHTPRENEIDLPFLPAEPLVAE